MQSILLILKQQKQTAQQALVKILMLDKHSNLEPRSFKSAFSKELGLQKRKFQQKRLWGCLGISRCEQVCLFQKRCL